MRPFQPIVIRRDTSGKILRQSGKAGYLTSVRTQHPTDTPTNQKPSDFDARADVTTVSLTTDRELDLHAFNMWIALYLQTNGAKIYRLKGILAMQGYDEQFVAQGVHMLFEGTRIGLWPVGEGARVSRLVFIGVDLSRAELEKGFLGCCTALGDDRRKAGVLGTVTAGSTNSKNKLS